MQTKFPISFIYIIMVALLALCTVTLFAVGHCLCHYEHNSWKDSGRLFTAVHEGKEPERPECPACQHDRLLRGRGPPDQTIG